MISYRVRPILRIRMTWVTEITQCVECHYFVDVQHFGPYRFWHHVHRFKEVDDGVLMEDILHYALPLGFMGEIAGRLFIHAQVRGIFEHRKKVLNQLFQKPEKSTHSSR